MAYEKGKPEPGIKAKLLDDRVRGNNDFIQPAINNEHNFVDADANNQDGDHTQGSARCFSQATAPAKRIDNSSFLSTDLGSLWIDTDDNAIYILTATTPTWTPISTEVIATLLAANRVFAGTLGVTGDFAVNTDKFTVTAASGNALVAGTLDSIGVATLADGSLLKTSAPPTTDPMITNKKFVDDQRTASTTDGFTPATEVGGTNSAGRTIFPNGFRIARGEESVSANNVSGSIDLVTYGFSNAYNIQLTIRNNNSGNRFAPKIGSHNATSFTIWNTNDDAITVEWLVIGQ